MISTPKVKTGRIPQLDGVRGLAILSVLIWHYYSIGPTPQTEVHSLLKGLFAQSWTGVDLFFVLSGFLICGILMEQKESQNYFKAFYMRRAFRIVPIYFVLLVTFLVCYYNINWHNNEALYGLLGEPHPIWSYATFLQNFFMASSANWGAQWLGITWSLSIEEQFYLLFPLAIKFLPNRRLPIFLITMIIAAPLFRLYLAINLDDMRAYISTHCLLPARMDALLMGALGAWMLRTPSVKKYFEKNMNLLYSLFLILGIGFFFFLRVYPITSIFYVTVTVGYTWIAGFYLVFLMITLLTSNKVILILITFKPLRALGIISYFVYLFHHIINVFTHYFIHGSGPTLISKDGAIATIFSFCITILLATFSWFLIEKPILKIGRRFKYSS